MCCSPRPHQPAGPCCRPAVCLHISGGRSRPWQLGPHSSPAALRPVLRSPSQLSLQRVLAFSGLCPAPQQTLATVKPPKTWCKSFLITQEKRLWSRSPKQKANRLTTGYRAVSPWYTLGLHAGASLHATLCCRSQCREPCGSRKHVALRPLPCLLAFLHRARQNADSQPCLSPGSRSQAEQACGGPSRCACAAWSTAR